MSLTRKQELEEAFSKINQEIPEDVVLIAVSKTYPASDIKLAYDLGQRDFGENKVQELISKAQELQDSCPEIRWHLIGPLQTNKVNMLAKVLNLYAVHSIDSEKILLKVSEKFPNVKLLLQVNTSAESEKHGFDNTEEIKQLIGEHSIYGLMTMGKIRSENFEEDAKSCFKKLVQLRGDSNSTLKLSMGMSADYKIALEQGSNFIRVGSLIFGKRQGALNK